jgi:hypothetical protein
MAYNAGITGKRGKSPLTLNKKIVKMARTAGQNPPIKKQVKNPNNAVPSHAPDITQQQPQHSVYQEQYTFMQNLLNGLVNPPHIDQSQIAQQIIPPPTPLPIQQPAQGMDSFALELNDMGIKPSSQPTDPRNEALIQRIMGRITEGGSTTEQTGQIPQFRAETPHNSRGLEQIQQQKPSFDMPALTHQANPLKNIKYNALKSINTLKTQITQAVQQHCADMTHNPSYQIQKHDPKYMKIQGLFSSLRGYIQTLNSIDPQIPTHSQTLHAQLNQIIQPLINNLQEKDPIRGLIHKELVQTLFPAVNLRKL